MSQHLTANKMPFSSKHMGYKIKPEQHENKVNQNKRSFQAEITLASIADGGGNTPCFQCSYSTFFFVTGSLAA